jgi:hypothetical protein
LFLSNLCIYPQFNYPHMKKQYDNRQDHTVLVFE